MTDKIGARLGVLDSPSYRPFINAFKQAWPWQGDRGGMQWDALVRAGHITAGGQLRSVAPDSGGFRTRVFFNMPAQAGGSGRWRLRWEGSATWDVYGGSNVTRTANEIQFDFAANGSSWVDLVVRTVGSQVSNISLVHRDDWADADARHIFRRQFLDEIAGYSTLRFDEWVGVLRSEQEGGLRITSWESRALPTDEIFYRFVPYEWMAALCRESSAAMWLCLPTAATTDHFRQAATLIRQLMPAPLRVYVEYSTKTWDFSGTPQAHYCAAQGRSAFGTNTGSEFRNWYGMRSAQMAQEWRAVWGGDARLHTVVQHQADWVGGDVDILTAPLWRDRSGQNGLPAYVAPHTALDVFTVHAQIDGGMAYGGRASQLEAWRTSLSESAAFDRIRDQLLTGNAWGADRTISTLRPKWRYYIQQANRYGMQVASYEVGNHLNGIGGSTALREFMHRFSVSPQMGSVYTETFNALLAEGFDGPLCMSVDCRQPDQNIMHGLQRWLGDHNPSWAAVDALIDDVPVVVVPEPPVEPEPEEPPVEPEPQPEEPDMADRDKLNELLAILKTTTASLETYLAENPIVVTPPVEEPKPEPEPEPQPEPTHEPQPEPAPSMMLPSFRYVQDFNIDRTGRQDWNDPNMHIYLPTWAGGDTGNGVGGSVGTPSMIDYNADKSVTINAGMVEGKWRNGAMQVNRPQAPAGKWGAVVTSHTARAVNAFFVYANNGKELDFELVKRDGVIGWAPAVHMPRTGGGRASSDKRKLALGAFKPGVQQRLTVELLPDRCMFWVDGVLFETVRPADMADGFIWDTTTNAYAMATIERHRSWAGWSSDDYAQPSRMSVHGFLLPRMP